MIQPLQAIVPGRSTSTPQFAQSANQSLHSQHSLAQSQHSAYTPYGTDVRAQQPTMHTPHNLNSSQTSPNAQTHNAYNTQYFTPQPPPRAPAYNTDQAPLHPSMSTDTLISQYVIPIFLIFCIFSIFWIFLNRNSANIELFIDNDTLAKLSHYKYIQKMGRVQLGTIPCILEWPAMAAAYSMNMLYLTLSNVFNLFNHLTLNLFLCVCSTDHLIEIQTDTSFSTAMTVSQPQSIAVSQDQSTEIAVSPHKSTETEEIISSDESNSESESEFNAPPRKKAKKLTKSKKKSKKKKKTQKGCVKVMFHWIIFRTPSMQMLLADCNTCSVPRKLSLCDRKL